MFKYLSRTLLTGFITLLPIVLTIYLLYWLAMTSEELMGGLLKRVLIEDVYFPGLGMLVGIVVIFCRSDDECLSGPPTLWPG
ncbi:hypothetical protein [Candidatus Reidiella endopervernicosa]|uniref:hypothetical protein n=1 Tax=Candidatus Reidiella endopervernicosa TaxID=2738883 RepID=UPI001F3FF98E|nr:hypothetical protein [Candidatus Reidiella endopervernicosa]